MSGARLTRRMLEHGPTSMGYESAETAAKHYEHAGELTAQYIKRKIDDLAGLAKSVSMDSSRLLEHALAVYSQASLFCWIEVFGQMNLPYEIVATKQLPPSEVQITDLMHARLLTSYLNTIRSFQEAVLGVGLTRRQRATRFAEMDSLPPRAMQDLVLGGWRFSAKRFSDNQIDLMLAPQTPLLSIAGECQPYHEVFSVIGTPEKVRRRQLAIAGMFTPTFQRPEPRSPLRR